uniref:RRM domain-containing protein n=2 Tax=Kalanchoe fedtschenkoi TaxID=63787 RepID=A0A7N0TE50_KALFE
MYWCLPSSGLYSSVKDLVVLDLTRNYPVLSFIVLVSLVSIFIRDKMQSDLGKLFIGGISWDTNEDRLKEYFSSYGEVLEAVIMKDRNTGRARGFGFIVFSDPAVAEKVILEKHNIDGRMVEAKKAVPRDDQSALNRNDSSTHGSPVPGRTRKIFVGGLASSVTESDFKAYFEQFGTITDVVVMYDHNTQRPRGFGFITYDSEEAVDEVLTKTFHELNGKMVEVKRAVPKELSPISSRSPVGGFNYGRVDILGGYNPAYSPTTIGEFRFGMDGRFSPMAGGRTGLSPFGSGYGMGMNYEPGMNASLIGSGNFNANVSYGRGLNPYIIGNNRFGNNLGYEGSNIGNNSLLSSVTRNLWGNGGLNFGAPADSRNSSVFMGSTNETIGGNTFGSGGVGWGSSQISAPGIGRANDASNRSGNLGYGAGDNNLSLGAGGFGRSIGPSAAPNSSYGSSNVAYDGAFTDLYTGGSVYGDSTWRFASSDRDGYGSLGDGVSASSDVSVKGSPGYVGSYSVASRQANKGPPSHGGLS